MNRFLAETLLRWWFSSCVIKMWLHCNCVKILWFEQIKPLLSIYMEENKSHILHLRNKSWLYNFNDMRRYLRILNPFPCEKNVVTELSLLINSSQFSRKDIFFNLKFYANILYNMHGSWWIWYIYTSQINVLWKMCGYIPDYVKKCGFPSYFDLFFT